MTLLGSDLYRATLSKLYCRDYLSRQLRDDGREFKEHRHVKIMVNVIGSADSSSVIKYGNTTVFCGIQLELAPPKAEEPDLGFLVINVESHQMCSIKNKPGPPSDHAQVVNKVVSDVIRNSGCVDLKALCIVPDKLAWVARCDALCIDNDGSLIDACVIGLMSCLKTLKLPTVLFDTETEEIEVDISNKTPLQVSGLPVTTSFCMLEHNERLIIFTEPTAYEEEMCGGLGANVVVCGNEGFLGGVLKFGGCDITLECQQEAMDIAKERSKFIKNLIDVCINTGEA